MNNELIHQKISRYSIETPAKIAAKDELGILSYSEFNARANDIATKLTRLGICKGTIVGVYLPYIKDFAVSAIAVWKVGGIFMPMDDAYPSQRLKYMVENSEASALISCRSLWATNSFTYPADKIIFIDDISEDKNFNYTADVNQDSTAMLLYTSGTTGQPKGVLHTYDMLSHFTDWIDKSVALNSDSKTAILTRFTFVGTVMFMFSTLFKGGTINLAPKFARDDIEFLYQFLQQEKFPMPLYRQDSQQCLPKIMK